MTQGYIFFGVDDFDSTRNIEHAHALSISLKLADPDRETCVVVHKFEHVPSRYEDSFDYIVELPFGRTEVNHHDALIDWWQLYNATPFDQTLYIDSNSLVVGPIGSLWEVMAGNSMMLGMAHDFRQQFTRNDQKFIPLDKNKIVARDATLVYFEKDEQSSEFFKLADPLFKNWRDVYIETNTEFRVNDFNYTLMFNVVASMTGNPIVQSKSFTYTDLSIDILWNSEIENPEPWMDQLNIWFTDGLELKINNYNQTGIVHYNDPDFLTADIVKKLNDNYRKEKKQKAA